MYFQNLASRGSRFLCMVVVMLSFFGREIIEKLMAAAHNVNVVGNAG